MVHGESRVRMEFRVPSRGLIGFRTEFLTITRGAGIASHVFDGYGPWVGEINSRLRGSLIADRAGPVTGVRRRRAAATAASCSSARAPWSTGAWSSASTRATRTSRSTSCARRSSPTCASRPGDELIKLTPPTILSLEQSLEFCANDECVEVTPENVRIRKVELDSHLRARARAAGPHGRLELAPRTSTAPGVGTPIGRQPFPGGVIGYAPGTGGRIG